MRSVVPGWARHWTKVHCGPTPQSRTLHADFGRTERRWTKPDESAGEDSTVMRERSRQLAFMALATGLAYYAAARVGVALRPESEAISMLWPPNAVLFGALLLAPVQWWLPLVLAAFPAHIVVEL